MPFSTVFTVFYQSTNVPHFYVIVQLHVSNNMLHKYAHNSKTLKTAILSCGHYVNDMFMFVL